MSLKINGACARMSKRLIQYLANKGQALMNRANAIKAIKLTITPLLAIAALSGNAQAVDLLAGGKQVASDTFGANSTIAVWLILAEVIVGVIGYIRTKNMMLLLGVAVVVVFTTVGFGLAA